MLYHIEPHEGGDWLDRLGNRVIAKHTDRLICHSGSAVPIVRRRDRPQGKIVVVHHGSYESVDPAPRSGGEALPVPE